MTPAILTVLGAFVAAPVGSLLWGFGSLIIRLSCQYAYALRKGHRFDALDKPESEEPPVFAGDGAREPVDEEVIVETPKKAGKFL